MNSSYLNMAAGAFLGTVFVVMSVSLVSDALFHTEAPEEEGFAIEVTEQPAGGAAQEEEQIDIATLLQSADPAEGEASFRKCASCHSAEKGGPNKVGPDLWGVVGRPVASHEGFSYSAAMQEFSQGGEVVWDYEHLAHFLHDPRGYISGTAMGFAGLSRPEELANVIAFLREQADEPLPLPDPAAAAPEEGAEGEAAGEEGAAPAEGAEAQPAEGEEQPAASEEAPAEGEDGAAAPAAEGEAPAEGGAASEGEAPADEQSAPAEGEEAPADAEQSGEAAPTGDQQPAAGEPASNDQPSADQPAGEAAPAANEGEEAAPAQEEQAPAEGGEQPAANDNAAPSDDAANDNGAATEEEPLPQDAAPAQ